MQLFGRVSFSQAILKLEDGIIKTFSLELETETVLIFPNCHPLLTIEAG